MSKKITIAEIAERAGVNASTVSRVLHAKAGSKISESVREKILNICNELNYRPSVAARSTATGKTYRVGLILGAIENDFSSPVFSNVVKGLCYGLQRRNYTLSVLWAESPSSSRNDQIRNFLMSEVADCYILSTAVMDGPIVETIRILKKPIIYISEFFDDFPGSFPSVRLNTDRACEELIRNIPESWYGKILYTGITSSAVKVRSVKKALENLKLKESTIRFHLYKPKELGFSFDRWAASEIARENFDLIRKQKLIWCASDLTALGIIDVLKEKGIEPGKEIALIGCDNLSGLVPFSGTPFLTTIDPHQEEFGRRTADVALDVISGKNISDVHTLEADVIFRKSFRSRKKQ